MHKRSPISTSIRERYTYNVCRPAVVLYITRTSCFRHFGTAPNCKPRLLKPTHRGILLKQTSDVVVWTNASYQDEQWLSSPKSPRRQLLIVDCSVADNEWIVQTSYFGLLYITTFWVCRILPTWRRSALLAYSAMICDLFA